MKLLKTTNKEVDEFERWFPCPCGSLEYPTIKYDKDGKFLRYSCTKCKDKE
jgi:hypothetical protein